MKNCKNRVADVSVMPGISLRFPSPTGFPADIHWVHCWRLDSKRSQTRPHYVPIRGCPRTCGVFCRRRSRATVEFPVTARRMTIKNMHLRQSAASIVAAAAAFRLMVYVRLLTCMLTYRILVARCRRVSCLYVQHRAGSKLEHHFLQPGGSTWAHD